MTSKTLDSSKDSLWLMPEDYHSPPNRHVEETIDTDLQPYFPSAKYALKFAGPHAKAAKEINL